VKRFVVLGRITDVQTIAVGGAIRELQQLRKRHGPGRWLKKKGRARVRLGDGTICFAEVHWYEAHGIGKKDLKLKRLLEDD